MQVNFSRVSKRSVVSVETLKKDNFYIRGGLQKSVISARFPRISTNFPLFFPSAWSFLSREK